MISLFVASSHLCLSSFASPSFSFSLPLLLPLRILSLPLGLYSRNERAGSRETSFGPERLSLGGITMTRFKVLVCRYAEEQVSRFYIS